MDDESRELNEILEKMKAELVQSRNARDTDQSIEDKLRSAIKEKVSKNRMSGADRRIFLYFITMIMN